MKHKTKIYALLGGVFLLSVVFSAQAQKKNIIKVKRSSSNIDIGDIVRLEWQAEKADTLWLEGHGYLADTGHVELMPIKTTTYYFYAKKRRKTYTKRIKVYVNYPEILSLSGTETVHEGTEGLLQWRTRNAAYVSIKGVSDSLPPNGSIKLEPQQKTRYHLVVHNANNIKTDTSFTMDIDYAEYAVATEEVLRGDTAVIKWRYKDAKSVKVHGFPQRFNIEDSLVFCPYYTRSYTLCIERNNGRKELVKRNIRVKEPGIKYFVGDNRIFLGETATLSWSTLACERVRIKEFNRDVPLRGAELIRPTETTTYTLQAWAKGEYSEWRHTVIVDRRNFAYNGIIDSKKMKDGTRMDFIIFASDQTNCPEEMKLYVLVVDEDGHFVSGLAPPHCTEEEAKEHFVQLMESHAGQRVYKTKDFSVKEVNNTKAVDNDICLTMDYSGSMGATIGKLEEACEIFIKNKDDKDRLSFVRFDSRLSLELPLTQSKKEILDSIKFEGLKHFGGSTALYAASDMGMQTLNDSTRNKVMVLFTDGYENSSFNYFKQYAYSAQQLAVEAFHNNIRMHIISYGPSVNNELLQYLSVVSGGMFYHISAADDILKVMKEIEMKKNHFYEITYKPRYTDGENQITLVYNNNIDKKATSKRKVFIGEDFDLLGLEYDSTNIYWHQDSIDLKGFLPITVPQVVANFEFAKDSLRKSYHQQVDYFIEYLEEKAKSAVLIAGHTDKVGSKRQCIDLSYRRANEVKAYMIRKGIAASRIFIVASGKEYPVWKEEDEKWKAAENRRVEIMLLEKYK
jgi:outer membrane protein OmpA-like peptidoglycan-associated protein/Mg-chelatase subunit ChlD